MKNETVYQDLFRGRLTFFPSTAGFKIYHFRHEKNHSRLGAGTGSSTATVNGPSIHWTQAQRVTWSSGTSTLTFNVPSSQKDASSFEVLSFRVAQTNSGTNPAGGMNFKVELSGGGKTKATYVNRFE